MRRGLYVCLGALAVFFVASAVGARAQVDNPTDTTSTTQAIPTTTAPPPPPGSTTSTTTRGTTSTTRSGTVSTTTSTTKPKSTAPVPPPASGASQPLVEDLLGSPVDVTTSTTLRATVTTATTVVTTTANATTISTNTNSPSGITLVLATVAWLASVGGVLVYAEDQRSTQWKHLARD